MLAVAVDRGAARRAIDVLLGADLVGPGAAARSAYGGLPRVDDRSAHRTAALDDLQAAADRRADGHAIDVLLAGGVDCRRCVRAAGADRLHPATDDRPARRAAALDDLEAAVVDRRADGHAVDVLLAAAQDNDPARHAGVLEIIAGADLERAAAVDRERCRAGSAKQLQSTAGIDDRSARRTAALDDLQTASVDRRAGR